MSLYSEYDPSKCGEKGEWASLQYANRVSRWRSWKNVAIVIGPVAVAHEGMWPTFDNKFELEVPSFVICGSMEVRTGRIEGQQPVKGLTIVYPLVYVEELRAFAELINDEDEPITHMWVDFGNADVIRAHRGRIPFVDLAGGAHEVPAETLSLTV